ncbi:hypothetical protein HYQ46_008111 [Verticillium longisporum]|nr:hypothetical protein HYQ46_008111 [Verticillium longisporum]
MPPVPQITEMHMSTCQTCTNAVVCAVQHRLQAKRRRRDDDKNGERQCRPGSKGHGDDDRNEIENVHGPPEMLGAQGARRVLKLPAPRRLVKPGAEQAGVAAEIAHHAAHRNLPNAGEAVGADGAVALGVLPAADVPVAVPLLDLADEVVKSGASTQTPSGL